MVRALFRASVAWVYTLKLAGFRQKTPLVSHREPLLGAALAGSGATISSTGIPSAVNRTAAWRMTLRIIFAPGLPALNGFVVLNHASPAVVRPAVEVISRAACRPRKQSDGQRVRGGGNAEAVVRGDASPRSRCG